MNIDQIKNTVLSALIVALICWMFGLEKRLTVLETKADWMTLVIKEAKLWKE